MKKIICAAAIVIGSLSITFGSYYMGARKGVEETISAYEELFYDVEIDDYEMIIENDGSAWRLERIQ